MIASTSGQDEAIIPTKRTLSPKWLVALLLVTGAFYFAAPVFSQWSSAIQNVDAEDLIFASVIKGELIRDVAVNGKVVAANAPQLYSTEKGKVTLLAKPGETVSQHQVVAKLDSPELYALIDQQRSLLAQLKIDTKRGELSDKELKLDLERQLNATLSEFNVAKREQERAERSYEKQVMSQVDWLKSKDRLDDAKRNFIHAEKRVALAQERLVFESKNREFEVEKQQLVLNELLRRQEQLSIKAPVAGVVGNWLVAQRNSVAANTPVMSIVDLSEYEAELSVPEFYADDLGLGLTVSMKIGNSNVSGEVVAISPEIEASQVKVRAKILDSSAVNLRQNQRLNARIEFEKKSDVLMVKKGAFIGSMGGKFAYRVIEQEGKQIPITVGSTSVEYVELIAGVAEGDRLIISDYEGFQQAKHIRIK